MMIMMMFGLSRDSLRTDRDLLPSRPLTAMAGAAV